MSVLKETAAAVVGVYAFILGCDAVFGVYDTRFDDSYYRASFYAPQPDEFLYASTITPAARIADAYAQFMPSEARSGKRYTALPTIIR